MHGLCRLPFVLSLSALGGSARHREPAVVRQARHDLLDEIQPGLAGYVPRHPASDGGRLGFDGGLRPGAIASAGGRQPTDTDLARALIESEAWAIPATWNRFAPSVYGIANRAFGRATDAEV